MSASRRDVGYGRIAVVVDRVSGRWHYVVKIAGTELRVSNWPPAALERSGGPDESAGFDTADEAEVAAYSWIVTEMEDDFENVREAFHRACAAAGRPLPRNEEVAYEHGRHAGIAEAESAADAASTLEEARSGIRALPMAPPDRSRP